VEQLSPGCPTSLALLLPTLPGAFSSVNKFSKMPLSATCQCPPNTHLLSSSGAPAANTDQESLTGSWEGSSHNPTKGPLTFPKHTLQSLCEEWLHHLQTELIQKPSIPTRLFHSPPSLYWALIPINSTPLTLCLLRP
jgi:hypothetical protein